MTPTTRRGPGDAPRASTSTLPGTPHPEGYQASPGERRPGSYLDDYLDHLDAKATASDDLEAAFLGLVDQLGDDRARALLFRRRCSR